MSLSSRRKLKAKDARRFTNAEPFLFAELAGVVCESGVLPEKELHECWQMASRVHQAFPKAERIADLAAGHGLLAWILVLLARTEEIPLPRTAVSVDITRPKSADVLAACLKAKWPQLEDAVHYVEASIDAVIAENGPDTLFVAIHACGSLSDRVMMAAIGSRSSLVIMPCCHSLHKQAGTLSKLADAAGLDASLIEGQASAIDRFRVDSLRSLGYQVSEEFIDAEITLCNRMIVGKIAGESSNNTEMQFNHTRAQAKRMGEVRAYEKVHVLNVSDVQAARELSLRPAREWKRVFDLSFWIEDDAVGESLASALKSLADDGDFTTKVWEHSRYLHPSTLMKSITFRFEMKSSVLAISKEDGLAKRKAICAAIENNYQLRV